MSSSNASDSQHFASSFKDLFDGRRELHADGSGQCVQAPVTEELIRDHLEGRRRIGVYPIAGAGHDLCRWVCIDVPGSDWELALLLGRRIKTLGLDFHIEKHAPEKWRVWVFFASWVQAWMVRVPLERVSNDLGERVTSPLTISPEHDQLQPNEVGRAIDLPLFGGDVQQGLTCFYVPDKEGRPRLVSDWRPDCAETNRAQALDEVLHRYGILSATSPMRRNLQKRGSASAPPIDPAAFGDLLPEHRLLLINSSISPEVATARGYRTVQKKTELEGLGFSRTQCRVPALLIPIRGVSGEIVLYQARPNDPRIEHGKAIKYETPSGSRMVIDVPPAVRTLLADPSIPLIITEGSRKADAAVSRGSCCIGLLGVWNWRGTNEFGGKAALADWEMIALNGRKAYIAFDSDVMQKAPVAQALDRLKALLESRGAHVQLIYLPAAADGTKVGLDDFLADNHTVDDLLRLATTEVRHAPQDASAPKHPYVTSRDGIVWLKPTPDGDVETPLTNFVAKIEAEIVEDDGLERRRCFKVLANVGEAEIHCSVPAEDFAGLNWVLPQLGAAAFIFPGFGVRDHARAAIQQLSGDVKKTVLFTHTGWRDLESGPVYLHAGGAIGAAGSVDGVEVKLPDSLSRFLLPDPPSGLLLVESIRASIRLLDVAPDRITAPIFATIYSAPLAPSDHSLFLFGPTGVLKTAILALAQQHQGAGLDANHLPGSWSSTSNFIEEMLFLAKDALVVLDDFAPTGGANDVQRLNRDADRVFRGVANHSGRGRLNSDGRPRATRPPRARVGATGEDLPRGESLRSRLIAPEVKKGDVSLEKLSACQHDASSGLYASSMSAYVRWLAPKRVQIRAEHAEIVRNLRDSLADGKTHLRSPGIVAELLASAEYFAMFAKDSGALDMAAAAALVDRIRTGLIEASAEHRDHQVAVDPLRRFLELLAAAMATGSMHLECIEGAPRSVALGWKLMRGNGPDGEESEGGASDDVWVPSDQRIGWADHTGVYLVPDIALALVQRIVRDQGETLTLSPYVFGRRLRDAGLLKSTERRGGRERLLIRKSIGGERHDVLHLPRTALFPFESASERSQGSQSAPSDDDPPGRDPERKGAGWDHSANSAGDGSQESGPGSTSSAGGAAAGGTAGTVGTARSLETAAAKPRAGGNDASRAVCRNSAHKRVWRPVHDLAAEPRCGDCSPPPDLQEVTWSNAADVRGGGRRA